MLADHLFGACLPTFGSCADRYCISGYGGGGKTVQEMLDLLKKVEGLDGLELVGNWHVNDGNIRDVGEDVQGPRLENLHAGPGPVDPGKMG